jgi:hypothetical protein
LTLNRLHTWQSVTGGFGYFLFFVVSPWRSDFIPAVIGNLLDERFASGLRSKLNLKTPGKPFLRRALISRKLFIYNC